MFWGNMLALSAAICWGLQDAFNKLLIPVELSATGVALSRIFGAMALMWIASIFLKGDKIRKEDRKLLIFAGVLMLGFIYVYSLAFNTASPIDVAIILTFQPLLVMLIGVIFKHRKVSGLEWAGMGVAFAGALFVIIAGGDFKSGKFIGNIFAIIAAISYATYLVVLERPSIRYRAVTINRWVFLVTAIISVPLIFTVKWNSMPMIAHPTLSPWLLLGFIILFPTAYCYLVTPPSIRMVGSEIFSIYEYLVPVITVVVCLTMKIDSFHWYQPVAFVIIIAGVLMTNRGKRRRLNAQGSDSAPAGK